MDRISFDLEAIRDKNYLTHNKHPYPAKIIPQVPRKLKEVLSRPGETVLDPICGSGTTLVEAKLLGRNGIGVDLNPIATLVTLCKTTCLAEKELSAAEDTVAEIGRHVATLYGATHSPAGESKDKPDVELPEFLNRDHWFEKKVLRELAVIKAYISRLDDPSVRTFLLTAFSSIIVKVSNQESDTRYAKKDKNVREGDTYEIYAKKVNEMITRMREFNKVESNAWTKVYTSDSRKLSSIVDQPVDLVITSPPYLNAYDYYLYHRLRMHWLGLYDREIQRLEIGSRNKHSDEDLDPKEYFDVMSTCFSEVQRILKPGGYSCIVVGDAIKDGHYIHVDQSFRKLMEAIGFALQKQISYPLRKYTSSFTKG